MPIYKKQEKGILNNDLYFEVLEEKGVKFLEIYRSIDMREMQGIRVPIARKHVWTHGDKLFKLSAKYYSGDISKYWIIGLVNKKPTDAHYSIGDEVLIPLETSVIENLLGGSNGNLRY